MTKTIDLIGKLNPKIRGWSNYYRHVVSSRTFSYVDDQVYRCIGRWTARRHNNKNIAWIRKKYFRQVNGDHWIFFGTKDEKDKSGNKIFVDLINASSYKITRHIKIRSDARLYDPAYSAYFAHRAKYSRNRAYCIQHITPDHTPLGLATGLREA